MKKISKHRTDLLYLAGLALAVLLAVLYQQRTHALWLWSDWSFHASRAEEIYQNLKAGSPLTYIATHTFHSTGVASFLFYPYLFLYPWAGLRFVLSPVNAFYGWYFLVNLATAWLSYCCMKSFSKKALPSLLFALLYTFTPYRIYLGTAVFGEFLAVAFLPLVFLGIYEILWRDRRKWYLLAIGGALVTYAHLLTVMLVLEFFAIIIIIKLISDRGIEKDRLLALLKSLLACICLVLPVIVPFLTDFVGHGVTSAKFGLSYTMSLSQLLLQSFGFSRGWKLSPYLLFFLLAGWLWIKGRFDWTVYGLGWLSFILASTIFPWHFLSKTFLAEVQITARYLSYTGLFVSLLEAKYLANGITRLTPRKRKALTVLLPLFGVLTSCSSMYLQVQVMKHPQRLASVRRSSLTKLPQTTISNQDYSKIFNYQVVYGEYDYYPAAAKKYRKQIARQVALLNKKKVKLQTKAGSNQLTYTIKSKGGKLDLPVLSYQHTRISLNGQTVSYQVSQRGTVQIKLPKGNSRIVVSYQPAKCYYYALAFCLLSWLTLAFYIYKKHLS
ncbi:hypothetical protein lacNasYZ03_06980 [Lactobacillus nasalidis]|uniref:Membrane protein 6-pyruvoyl-tetrahydropterin synthase-related domain-containing protein n=1 Tax=Lactobacillus nasalidis TaxID=2797258 RepID=A0ABQ3W690_9LACO|nr:hypothetical protein [Lactobacillus nasalidis]GHV97231.1 hypothetical protein lacNasYZ01_04130 [Lactobacillus nasalidis]GHV99985.1 hypothetical protein lacNasYZ02_14150 [Lactobacillus nasalidis]GHW01011.1 hypothetical protein lacNasYZ03_06980 [Lactobacillus nasalidis]